MFVLAAQKLTLFVLAAQKLTSFVLAAQKLTSFVFRQALWFCEANKSVFDCKNFQSLIDCTLGVLRTPNASSNLFPPPWGRVRERAKRLLL